jgi:hypothetical protein
VNSMPTAIPAVLFQLKLISRILFIFHTRIIPVFAFCALKYNDVSHFRLAPLQFAKYKI